jgi:hypothetical protein
MKKLLLLSLLLAMVLAAGCQSKAQIAFTTGDVQLVGQYIRAAQPIAEAYAAMDPNAAPIVSDMRLWAAQIRSDQETRLAALSTQGQAVDAAKTVLDAVGVMLVELYKAGVIPHESTTQPSGN